MYSTKHREFVLSLMREHECDCKLGREPLQYRIGTYVHIQVKPRISNEHKTIIPSISYILSYSMCVIFVRMYIKHI